MAGVGPSWHMFDIWFDSWDAYSVSVTQLEDGLGILLLVTHTMRIFIYDKHMQTHTHTHTHKHLQVWNYRTGVCERYVVPLD
jgi:hypothetical protein